MAGAAEARKATQMRYDRYRQWGMRRSWWLTNTKYFTPLADDEEWKALPDGTSIIVKKKTDAADKD